MPVHQWIAETDTARTRGPSASRNDAQAHPLFRPMLPRIDVTGIFILEEQDFVSRVQGQAMGDEVHAFGSMVDEGDFARPRAQ